VFAKAIGSLFVVENLQDAHDQKLLRGHDSPISALAVSASGSYLASGQMGTEKYRGRAAPIFIWDPVTGKRLSVLKGLTTRVNAIAFSMDERFVCGCGEVSAAHNHLPLSHTHSHSPYTTQHRTASSTCGTCRQPRPSPASAYSPQPTW
jgi:WD40 repeat protein